MRSYADRHNPLSEIGSQSVQRITKVRAPTSLWDGLVSPRLRASDILLIPLPHPHTFFPRELPDRPSLRSLSDHRFIVGAQRVRRMVWRLPFFPYEAARSKSRRMTRPAGENLRSHPPLLS
jgi:hypothetical protein